MQISLKVHGDMDIGGVKAPVMLPMVGLYFVRMAPLEGMFCIIWLMLFL
jgi:hypothetical protein